MILTKIKTGTLLAAAAGLLATGVGVAARHPAPDRPADEPTPAVEPGAALDPGRQPLTPPAATPEERWLGEVRAAYLAAMEDYKTRRSTFDHVARTSKMLLETQQTLAKTPAERRAALSEHRDRMLAVARTEQFERRGSAGVDPGVAEAKALVAEAEFRVARAGVESAGRDSAPTGEASDVPGDRNPKSAAILRRLDEPVAMNFPNDTPLEDVVKYIRQVTQTPTDQGIPIYVDPQGLIEADKTLASPIRLDLDGIPLRRTLQLMLKPMGLAYFVEDGMLVITSVDSAGGLGPPIARPSPLSLEVEKASRGELTEDEMKALVEKLKLIQEIRKLHDAAVSVHDPAP